MAEAMPVDTDVYNGSGESSDSDTDYEFPLENINEYCLHDDRITCLHWHPTTDLIATGSSDGYATILDLNESPQLGDVHQLKHYYGQNSDPKDHHVRCVQWRYTTSGQDPQLLTGSDDGVVRVHRVNGFTELQRNITLDMQGTHHNAPKCNIRAAKFNEQGNYVVTGSDDHTCIVWDVNQSTSVQQFKFHTGEVTDLAWCNDNTFASCSADENIILNRVGSDKPLRTWSHNENVNQIDWCPQGMTLASASDDKTVRLWQPNKNECVHKLEGFEMEVYTVRWAPVGKGSDYPNGKLVLASGSADRTVCLWDPETGQLICMLEDHWDSVEKVAFSPDGQYLASAGMDKVTNIYSVSQQKLVRSFNNAAGVCYDVGWNYVGNKVAMASSDHRVYVLDMRMLEPGIPLAAPTIG